MLTLQELLDIARRYATAMADAMIAACVQRAIETGETLTLRDAPPDEGRESEWDRMMRSNTDTRWNHC
jgi:hypothetical protein